MAFLILPKEQVPVFTTLVMVLSLCWLLYMQFRERKLWKKTLDLKDKHIQLLSNTLKERTEWLNHVRDFNERFMRNNQRTEE